PMALTRDAISSDVVEKEKEIYKTLAVQEGKPENIIDKIVSNKLEKFYQENVLLEQSFLQDEKKTVEEILNEFNKKSGNTLSISKMVRFQLG
ncbi:MAG TPA: elongation factor Ts, partial [Bacteroidetes bacterium]|nr:elongation factor Ts [Bacteroidota bacterium]